jgi:hypothetical protein
MKLHSDLGAGFRASSANCASLFSGAVALALAALTGDERMPLPNFAEEGGGTALGGVGTIWARLADMLADVLCMMRWQLKK